MFQAAPSTATVQLLQFLSTDQSGLEHAAELLGGPFAVRRVRSLIEAFSVPKPRLTRRIARELLSLHRLLSLEDVADFDKPAAYYFSLIDPADPCVAEICCLTDRLYRCLVALIAEDMIEKEDFDVAA